MNAHNIIQFHRLFCAIIEDPCLRLIYIGTRLTLTLTILNSTKSYREYLFILHLPHHPCVKVRVNFHHSLGVTKPNTTKSFKIFQRISPKQDARGVAQSPYPIYRHGKGSLSKQWHIAGDSHLPHGKSRVRAPTRMG